MIAATDAEVCFAQVMDKERPRQERHKADPLLVKLAELVDPANGIIGFRLAVRKIDHGSVPQAGIARPTRQLGHRAWVITREDVEEYMPAQW